MNNFDYAMRCDFDHLVRLLESYGHKLGVGRDIHEETREFLQKQIRLHSPSELNIYQARFEIVDVVLGAGCTQIAIALEKNRGTYANLAINDYNKSCYNGRYGFETREEATKDAKKRY